MSEGNHLFTGITSDQQTVLRNLTEGAGGFGELLECVHHSTPSQEEIDRLHVALHNLQEAIVLTRLLFSGCEVKHTDSFMYYLTPEERRSDARLLRESRRVRALIQQPGRAS